MTVLLICLIMKRKIIDHRRKADIKADYVGVDVPNEFVVGYGLDFNQYYRNLPYIGVLKRSVYEN